MVAAEYRTWLAGARPEGVDHVERDHGLLATGMPRVAAALIRESYEVHDPEWHGSPAQIEARATRWLRSCDDVVDETAGSVAGAEECHLTAENS